MAAVTKNSKNYKINFFPESLGIIGYNFAWNLSGTLVFKIKEIKKSTAELGYSDLFSVYRSNLARMSISQENMNVFWSDSITMVAEWNHFIYMQIDNPRWLPGAVSKKSTNTKMTVSQEPLDEIDPSLCQNVSL